MAPVRGFTGWIGTILGTPDPLGLGRFYAGLLGGQLDEGDPTFVTLLVRPTDTTNLAFQLEPGHVPPVWPTPGTGEQQMQVHLDVGVASLAGGGRGRRGARRAAGRLPAPGRRPGHARPGRPPVLPLPGHGLRRSSVDQLPE